MSLDDKWKKVHENLVELFSNYRKSTDGQASTAEFNEIVDDLDELKTNEARKLSSMSQDETPLLDEFRNAFQEVSRWINKAEAQLGSNRESQERAIGQEIGQWEPKMTNLRRMAEKLVQLFVSQRDDVEPEMASLAVRWEHIVREVEKRIKTNQSFRMVEVEEIKTTISHLSIPLSDPVVTITQPSPVVDPDEEIETLIEDDPQSKITFSSQDATIAHYALHGDSSSESLSGGDTTLRQKNPKSPPPQPLPKPRWYLEQRAQGIKLPVSPERVKITQNTLPQPQKLIGTVEKAGTHERQMPEKAVLMSASTTPSTTIESPASLASVDDELLAKENAVIDHLLAETELQLEEVARHVRGLATSKDKDQLEFEDEMRVFIDKIEIASRKLDEVDNEHDLTLRQNLVLMELRTLEAEVPALITRGDALVMLVTKGKKGSPNDANALINNVSDLKNAWHDLIARFKLKKSSIAESEVKLKQFKKAQEQLKRWLSSAKVKLVRAAHDEKVARQFMTEVKNRKSEMDHLNLVASELQQRNALSGHEMALTIINSDWEEILEKMKTLVPKNANGNPLDQVENKLFATAAPGSPLMKSAPVEVATRMAKMLDALAAVDRQMDTQTLSVERPCENLPAQSEALTTVKNALDRLRPTLKQTDQDLDRLSSGNLSMEYFEKLSNSNSKLHGEWDRVRYRYAQRQDMWNKSKKLETELESRKQALEIWLRSIGENNAAAVNISNEDIEAKGKLAAELTTYCKQFMTKTSAQEALAVQSEVDGLLRRWRSVLAVLTKERKAASGLCERVDQMSLLMAKGVNASDPCALMEAIQELVESQTSIADLRTQFCQKINNEGLREPMLLKARTTIERLAVTIPRRVDTLQEKEQRLSGLLDKRKSILAQIEEVLHRVKEAQKENQSERKQSMFKALHMSVSNIQYEVNRVLNDYVCLEREVTTNQFDMNTQTSEQMQALKNTWLQLSLEVRQLATPAHEIHLKKSAAAMVEMPSMSASLTSPQSSCSITNESCVSPTTCSQSSFLSDERPSPTGIDFDDLEKVIEKEMQQALEAAQLNLAVHDPQSIRALVDQQQQVMRQLENKRDTLETIGSRLQYKGRNDVLQSRLGVLRDRLDVTKHRVLSRKSECTAMASDSEQFARKLNEIESWLTRLEGILQSTYPMGQTLDVLEFQHQSSMDALKELSKYEHHITLFTQVCTYLKYVFTISDFSI